MADWSEKYLRAYRNRNHNLVTNGEAAVLQMLPADSVRVAMDVGCHAGAWTDHLLNRQQAASVIGFEPTLDLAIRLEGKYADEPRFSLERVALGQAPGSATLSVQDESSVNFSASFPVSQLSIKASHACAAILGSSFSFFCRSFSFFFFGFFFFNSSRAF